MSQPEELKQPEHSGNGGEMAARLREFPWEQSSSGPRSTWPQSLRTAEAYILASPQPLALCWGPELRLLYNDAFRPLLGTRHPAAVGQPVQQVVSTGWTTLEPHLTRVLTTGERIVRDTSALPTSAASERTTSCSYDPIRDETGAVAGVLIQCAIAPVPNSPALQFGEVFENTAAFVVLLRVPGYEIEYANPAFRTLLLEQAIDGRPMTEVVTNVNPQFIQQILDKVMHTGQPFIAGEFPVPWTKDGVPIIDYVNLLCQPLWSNTGAIDYIVVHGVHVTSQVEVRQANMQIEQRLATILDQLPVGVVIAEAPSGKIIEGNAQVEAILRHPILPSATIEAYGHWLGFHPDGRPVQGTEWPLARALQGEVVLGEEFRYQRGDGTMTWIRVSGTPVHDPQGAIIAGVVIISDIAEQRNADTALRESEARLQQALEAGGLGSWIYDFQTDTVEASADCKRIFGLAADATLTYQSFIARLHPTDQGLIGTELTQAVELRHDITTECRVMLPDGLRRWVRIAGRATYRANGTPVALIGTVLDITEQKQAEDEREQLLVAERTARQAAEAAVLARDTFLSIAAHELRTPITALKGTAQLLLRQYERNQVDTERLIHNLQVLERSTNRLAELTDDLLDVSRLRTGELTLDQELLDLRTLVQEAVTQQEPQCNANQQLVLDIPPTPCLIPGDRLRLGQVFTNLLSNAMKYSPAGGTIIVTVTPRQGGVLTTVCDEGIGLPPEAESTIFNPFGRAPNAIASHLPGLGLGLYICRMIIEQHSGWIRASSAGEHQGTTISFWLPSPVSDPTATEE